MMLPPVKLAAIFIFIYAACAQTDGGAFHPQLSSMVGDHASAVIINCFHVPGQAVGHAREIKSFAGFPKMQRPAASAYEQPGRPAPYSEHGQVALGLVGNPNAALCNRASTACHQHAQYLTIALTPQPEAVLPDELLVVEHDSIVDQISAVRKESQMIRTVFQFDPPAAQDSTGYILRHAVNGEEKPVAKIPRVEDGRLVQTFFIDAPEGAFVEYLFAATNDDGLASRAWPGSFRAIKKPLPRAPSMPEVLSVTELAEHPTDHLADLAGRSA